MPTWIPNLGHTISVRPDFYRSLAKHFGMEDYPPDGGGGEASHPLVLRDGDRTRPAHRNGMSRRSNKQGLWDDTIVIYTLAITARCLGNAWALVQKQFLRGIGSGSLDRPLSQKVCLGQACQGTGFPARLVPRRFVKSRGRSPIPSSMERALCPPLPGARLDPNRSVFAEYADYGIHVPMRMIRKGKYKLMYAEGYDPALFDLENDPNENNNPGREARIHEYRGGPIDGDYQGLETRSGPKTSPGKPAEPGSFHCRRKSHQEGDPENRVSLGARWIDPRIRKTP